MFFLRACRLDYGTKCCANAGGVIQRLAAQIFFGDRFVYAGHGEGGESSAIRWGSLCKRRLQQLLRGCLGGAVSGDEEKHRVPETPKKVSVSSGCPAFGQRQTLSSRVPVTGKIGYWVNVGI